MFGSADNLRKYQTSVLLGITKAPRYIKASGQPLSINNIRLRLNQSNSPIAQILANRIFLFDPLDRATDNLDFWHREQLHTVISQLRHIPQQQAKNLFQTTFTDGDKVYLLDTVRQLKSKIVTAITQGDVTELDQHWQLLQRLRIIEHPEVEQLVEGQVLPAINVALRQLGDIETWTHTHNFAQAGEQPIVGGLLRAIMSAVLEGIANAYKFDRAEARITLLTQLIQQLPGAKLDINPDELRRQLARLREQYEENERAKEELRRLREEREALELEIRNREREPECAIL
jgi:hypothetical protein